jgi:tetratricopeptide (TPR) repeat protein
LVTARAWRALALAALGRFEEAIEHGEAAMRGAESGERPHELVAAHAALGSVCLAKGDHFRATLLLERALALAQSWNIGDWASAVAASLAHARVLAGRLSEAFAVLQTPDSSDPTMTALGADSSWLRSLAHAHLVAGHAEAARAEAGRALDLARARGERGLEAWILHLLGEIARSHEPPAAVAESSYRSALALADERGMRPLSAHCHRGLGLLRRRTGEHTRGEDHLTTATAMFREMDMRFWLETYA